MYDLLRETECRRGFVERPSTDDLVRQTEWWQNENRRLNERDWEMAGWVQKERGERLNDDKRERRETESFEFVWQQWKKCNWKPKFLVNPYWLKYCFDVRIKHYDAKQGTFDCNRSVAVWCGFFTSITIHGFSRNEESGVEHFPGFLH